jgi:hypothetical protein
VGPFPPRAFARSRAIGPHLPPRGGWPSQATVLVADELDPLAAKLRRFGPRGNQKWPFVCVPLAAGATAVQHGPRLLRNLHTFSYFFIYF